MTSSNAAPDQGTGLHYAQGAGARCSRRGDGFGFSAASEYSLRLVGAQLTTRLSKRLVNRFVSDDWPFGRTLTRSRHSSTWGLKGL